MNFQTEPVVEGSNEYWTNVRATRAALANEFEFQINPNRAIDVRAPWVVIAALERKATLKGVTLNVVAVFEVAMEHAAKLIGEGKHRLATKEEADQMVKERKVREEECRRMEELSHPERAAQRSSNTSAEALQEAVGVLAQVLTQHAENNKPAAPTQAAPSNNNRR